MKTSKYHLSSPLDALLQISFQILCNILKCLYFRGILRIFNTFFLSSYIWKECLQDHNYKSFISMNFLQKHSAVKTTSRQLVLLDICMYIHSNTNFRDHFLRYLDQWFFHSGLTYVTESTSINSILLPLERGRNILRTALMIY